MNYSTKRRALLALAEAAVTVMGGQAFKAASPRIQRLVKENLAQARELYAKAKRAKLRYRAKQINTEGLPSALAWLIESLGQEIENITSDLASGAATLTEWQAQITDWLAQYGAASYMAGLKSEELQETALGELYKWTQAQVSYLDAFVAEIKAEEEFIPGWNARAEMYANGIKQPYWEGATKILPLPSMPGEGTQCLTNCRCKWRVEPLDEDAGDYDAYWEWEEDAEHCQTCTERRRQWYPIRIRNGRIQ